MQLATTTYPAKSGASGPPLIVAHGLFGSARNWRALAKRMSADRDVIAVDMRNHGKSGWSETHDYPSMAGDLAEVIEAAGAPAHVLGHSMGGKAAMRLAQLRPDLVDRLIVADIAPVGYDHSLQAQIAAMQAVDLGVVSKRSDVEAILAHSIDAPAERSFLALALDLSGDEPAWELNLAALAANMAVITDYPDDDALFAGETLFLSGGLSDYVQPEHGERIAALFPASRHEVIDGAGHWLHAEKPREFLAAVEAFLG